MDIGAQLLPIRSIYTPLHSGHPSRYGLGNLRTLGWTTTWTKVVNQISRATQLNPILGGWGAL